MITFSPLKDDRKVEKKEVEEGRKRKRRTRRKRGDEAAGTKAAY